MSATFLQLNMLVKVVLSLISIVLLGACDTSGQPVEDLAKTPPKPTLTVSLISPQFNPLEERLTASGNVQPWQLVDIGTEITGVRLIDVLVNVGDTVRKGQLLARLDDASIAVELKLQRAVLAEAEANLASANLSLTRAQKLDASRAISQQDLLQYETEAKTSAAKVGIAQAQVNAQELRLRYTRILAPDDGVIAYRAASVGALGDGAGELFKMIRKSRVEWRAELRPEQQAKVFVGQAVELRDPLGQMVSGRVRQIAPTADMESRTSLVYVDIQPSKVMKPGVLVTGDFLIAKRSALTVPQSALVVRDGFSYAMKVGAEQVVKPVKLDLGVRQGNSVEILGGLTANDQIVAEGAAFLHEGDKVSVVKTSPATPNKNLAEAAPATNNVTGKR